MTFRSFRLVPLMLCAASLLARPAYPDTCRRIEGFLEESLATTNCNSPVGLCTIAQAFGQLSGQIFFTASDFIIPPQAPTTNVIFVTGDSVITNARLDGKRGSLRLKDSAAFQVIGEGNLVDIQTVVGGTGDLAGATGTLRITGTFSAVTGGTSKFEGQICLP